MSDRSATEGYEQERAEQGARRRDAAEEVDRQEEGEGAGDPEGRDAGGDGGPRPDAPHQALHLPGEAPCDP